MAYEWTNSEKQLFTPVTICRQPELFDFSKLRKSEYKTGDEYISWQWAGNTPIFGIPKTALEKLPTSDSTFRDLIAYCSTLYREQRCPADNRIYTSFRQIAESIGIDWWETIPGEINKMLLLASMLKVIDMPIKTFKGKDVVKELTNFSFIVKHKREVECNGKAIKPANATLTIVLDETYTDIIKKSPIAPIPVEALIATKKAPNRLIPIAKNMIYRLAARTPHTEFKYLFSNDFKQQIGISPTRRNDKARKTFENAISYIEPVMLADFNYDKTDNSYHFKLRGKKVIAEKKSTGTESGHKVAVKADIKWQ